MQGREPKRLFLVGKTGGGKSATGNTILGKKAFDIGDCMVSETRTAKFASDFNQDRQVEVTDCPGLFDTGYSKETTSEEIVRALAFTHPGPHAILYVIAMNARYTQEDYDTYNRIKDLLQADVTRYMIVVFTHADKLFAKGWPLHEYLSRIPDNLKKVLQECGNRHVALNNESQDGNKVRELLRIVDDLGGTSFISPYHNQVQEFIEKEIKKSLEQSNRKEAQNNPYAVQCEREAKEAKRRLREAEAAIRRAEREASKPGKEMHLFAGFATTFAGVVGFFATGGVLPAAFAVGGAVNAAWAAKRLNDD